MRILISHHLPFALAHGGTQTVIVELMEAYRKLGVDADYERWWLDEQDCDVLHFFGRPPITNVRLAKKRGYTTVMTEYLDQVSSRPRWYRFLQRNAVRHLGRLARGGVDRLGWDVYRTVDALVYTTRYEWDVAQYVFSARPERGHIIPHGLTESALSALSAEAPPEDYLVSVSTIAPRKNNVLLAEAARAAKVPVHFIGKPYAEDDYYRRFLELVDDKYVHYHGFVSEDEKYSRLVRARGFALLSQFESGCVAVYEAAAAGLPLLLSALPWAETGYPAARDLSFVAPKGVKQVADSLAAFYERSHRHSEMTFPVVTWAEVAQKYLEVYAVAAKHS